MAAKVIVSVSGGMRPADPLVNHLVTGDVFVDFPTAPNYRTERGTGNSASPIRPATAQEIADYDAAQVAAQDAEAAKAFDELRVVKALALVVADLTGKTPAQMAQLVRAKYKGLA